MMRSIPVAQKQLSAAEEAVEVSDVVHQISDTLQRYHAKSASSRVPDEYHNQIAEIRDLVYMIQYQTNMQTPSVAPALATVKIVAKEIEKLLKLDSVSPAQLAGVMNKLKNATINLRQSLPGDFNSAKGNEMTGGVLQVNAPIGKKNPEGQVISEAVSNKASGGIQVNSFVYGEAVALALIAATGASK